MGSVGMPMEQCGVAMTSLSVSDLYASDRGPRLPVGEWLARGAVGASALGGAVAAAHPTGSPWSDVALTAGVAAGLAALGPVAGLSSVLVALLLAVIAGGGSAMAFAALGAAALVLVKVVGGRDVARFGSVAAAGIAAQGLLRLDDLGGSGRSAVVAAIGMGTVVAAASSGRGVSSRSGAWPRSWASVPRWAPRVVVVTVGLGAVVTVVAGVALWRAVWAAPGGRSHRSPSDRRPPIGGHRRRDHPVGRGPR